MDASFDNASPLRELRVCRDQEMNWRLACTGDLDCGIVTTQPVAAAQEEVIALGAPLVERAEDDPAPALTLAGR
jgi:hypothetical protein